MKKHLFLKSLLVLIGVLITSLTTNVRAYEFDYPVVYFDNQSGTDWSNTMFLYYYSYKNGSKGSQGYSLKKIDDTKLWCQYLQHNRGTDMDYFEYIFGDIYGAWEHESHSGSSDWNTRLSSFRSQANSKYSGTATTNMNKKTWLATSTGTSNLTVTWKTDDRQQIPPSSMKFNQTVNVVVNGNSSPSTSPAAISITSHYWTAWDAVSSAGSSTAITKGGSTITDAYNNAAYTAETSVEVTSIQDGYYFVGWYDAPIGGSLVSDANPYTYYPREANTLYARFESKHTVNIYASMHGGAVGCTTSPSNGTAINNVGYYSTADISATAGNGCFFDQWSTTGGVTVGGTKTNPTTVKTAGLDGTVTAHFYTQWAIMGGHADSYTGSSDALGDWLDSYNDLVYVADNSFIGTITLPASTTLKFKVWDRENNHYWGCNTTITSSVNDYDFYDEGASDKNCTLTTGAAGDYTFAWNAADHKLSIIFPGDKAKSTLKKNSIIYFDITTGNGTTNYWHQASFTARFWFKTLAGKDYSSVDKASSTMIESWHYYAPVPDNDNIGRIQMNRMDPDHLDQNPWNTASTINKAIDRDDAYQNCLVYNHDSWSPTISWSTYCPPMSSATLSANNGEDKTIVYAGAGTNENPYIVATGANIYVTASSTSALNDANMTPHYLFYQAGSAAQAYPGAEDDYIYRITSSGTKQAMTVYAKNYYNGTYGTVSPVSNSIYYEARQPYNVSVAGLSHVTLASGRTGLTGAVEGVNYVATFTADEGYNLPASAEGGKIVVLRSSSDIAANCTWSVSAGVGTLTVPAAYVTADLAISVYGVLKTYDITYNGGTYGSGSLDGGTKTHFVDYELSSNSTAFTRDGYAYDGWSVNAAGSTKDYEFGGTYDTEADQTFYPHWIPAYSVTHTLSHINCTSGATGSIAGVSGRNYVATFTALAGYELPSTITVTVGGSPLTKDVNYTWSISAGVGTLTVLSANVTAAIVITITGTPETLRFTSGSDWHTASNWTPACVPTIEHDVIIPKTCWISHPNAQAKSVTIEHYGEKEGKLYINSTALYTGALLIAEGITAIHEEGGDPEPTTKNDLQIVTDYYGNGGLICGEASDDTEAQYIFYSKVYRYGSWYINQYVGIPFVNMDPYDWYGVSIFEYNPAKDQWMTPVLDEGKLKPFTAYNIISKMSGVGYTNFYTDGILNLPGTVPDPDNNRLKVLKCGWRDEADFDEGKFPASIDETEGHQDYMFANSWTAPISVADMSEDDFYNVSQVLYVFNAGWSNPDADAKKEVGDLAGQWTQFPIEAAKAGGLAYPAFIPATQAFLVTATAVNATLTLDYKKHVFDPAKNAGTINTSPTRAPRYKKSESPISKLIMTVSSDTTIADILHLFEREDFTSSYDDGWEGYKIFGRKSAPQLYALQGESKMSIEATPEMHGTLLGFKAGTDTNAYVLSFEYNDEEPLYLYDRETAEFTQITNDATYSFTTSDTDEHQRFIISRVNSPSILTSLEEIANESVKHAEKYFENNMLFIRRGDKVYSVDGRLVK